MSYKTGNLHVTRWISIEWSGRELDGPGAEGTISLEHSCDSWEIGGPQDAVQLLHDLTEAIAESERVVSTPKTGLLKEAQDNGWNYYCAEHEQGFVKWYGSGGLLEHGQSYHCQTGTCPPDWFHPSARA